MIGNIIAETPWEIKRLGKFSASQIADLLTEPKLKKDKEAGNLSETAKKYIRKKCSEIITGTTRQMNNWALEWGSNYEPEAAFRIRDQYPDFVYLGKETQEFFEYSDFSGGSPDGYSGGGSVVHEIKCPESPENHVAYCMIQDNEDLIASDKDYYYQVQMNMLCVGKHFGIPFSEMKAVFTSYCPIVNDPYKDIHHVEILPDMDFYEKITKVIPRAEKELAETVEAMTKGVKKGRKQIQKTEKPSPAPQQEDNRPSLI